MDKLEAVKAKMGVQQVYDLSATPFFLKGSGYSTTTPSGKKLNEGVLFPWVVSDFALIDAIECGIAKVPRVPVADDTMKKDPIYRRLWDIVGPQTSRNYYKRRTSAAPRIGNCTSKPL